MNTAALTGSPTACKECCLAVLARLNTRAQKWRFADEGDLQVVSPREATENCFNLATSNAMFRLETHVFRRGRLDFGWRLNGEASVGCAWPGLTRLEWKISYSSSWQAFTRFAQSVLVARIRTGRRMQPSSRCGLPYSHARDKQCSMPPTGWRPERGMAQSIQRPYHGVG